MFNRGRYVGIRPEFTDPIFAGYAAKPMNPTLHLLAPLALLLPGSAGEDGSRDLQERVVVGISVPAGQLSLPPPPHVRAETLDEGLFSSIAQSFRVPSQEQVRIEQRLTIRIAPRPPAMPDFLDDLPANGFAPRVIERKMGRCLPLAAIAGVQASGDNKLILFMRDRRIVSATLEKACRARDFYSGFYVARNSDGLLCVERDELQSRSGSNCQLKGMKQLIEQDD